MVEAKLQHTADSMGKKEVEIINPHCRFCYSWLLGKGKESKVA